MVNRVNEKNQPHPPDGSENPEVSSATAHVMYCLQPAVRSGINIFNPNSDSNLSEVIFRSICKGKSIVFIQRVFYD